MTIRDVTIEDARGREAVFTLDRNGFALVKARTAVADFYSPDEIKNVYYPEVERLLCDKLGASRVFVFDHNVRNATREGVASCSRLAMTRPRVSGSSKSMTIISPWAKVENRAIAVPSGMTAVAKPIAVINTEPIARPAL